MSTSPRILANRFEVGELIGRGGMAEVHKGYDTRLGRDVAIKMLRSELARDQSFLVRFRREAQSAAGLNHPAIVAIYDSGEEKYTEVGGAFVDVPFIVMEYVSGRTLREVLTEAGHLEPEEAARLTEGVLDALAYSHQNGIVHRDIKPANVMVADDGSVKVMDFGIARAIADTAATMTQTQAVIGTAQYLSPEQAQGQTVDERSDLYSTGCMLFELLTGRAPFVGDTPVAIAYQHVGERAPKPSDLEPGVPSAFDDIVAHALVKDRAGRYQSARAFRSDLAAARAGEPISAAAAGSALGAAVTEQILVAGASAAGAARAGGVVSDMPTEVYTSRSQIKEARTHDTATMPAIGRDPDLEPEKKRGGTFALLFVLAAVLIAGLVWGVMTLLGGDAPTETKVQVPKVVEMQQADAERALKARGLIAQFNPVANAKPAGEVLTQSSPPNTYVPEGTRINMDVSTGPNSVNIPDVRGETEADARRILTEAGFVVAAQSESVDDSEYAKGEVDSTDPAIGDAATEGSTVRLKVSSGKVTVPNVVGKKETEARDLLVRAGLQTKTEYVQSDQPEGTVVSQEPKDGLLDRDGVVVIRVATPKPPTVTTTWVTETPTPTPTTTTSEPTPPPTTDTPTTPITPTTTG